MIVDGKMVWYDLSRFASCSIPKVKICDLMSIPAFRDMVTKHQDEISDAWVIESARSLTNALRILPDEKAQLDENEIRLRRKFQSRAKDVYKWAIKTGLYHE